MSIYTPKFWESSKNGTLPHSKKNGACWKYWNSGMCCGDSRCHKPCLLAPPCLCALVRTGVATRPECTMLLWTGATSPEVQAHEWLLPTWYQNTWKWIWDQHCGLHWECLQVQAWHFLCRISVVSHQGEWWRSWCQVPWRVRQHSGRFEAHAHINIANYTK